MTLSTIPTKTTNVGSVMIACPFCGKKGDIPDGSKLKRLKCRQCGTRFHPKPRAFASPAFASSFVGDLDEEDIIDVDAPSSQAPIDLGVKTNEGLNVYVASARAASKTSKRVGPLKFIVTAIAILLHFGILIGSSFGILDSLQVLNKLGPRPATFIVHNGEPSIQTRDDAVLYFMFAFASLFFNGITFPFLGAYVSHAKHRGPAEGYDMVIFFWLIGLIVVLCLPTNREGS
jgi:hypothetical protein